MMPERKKEVIMRVEDPDPSHVGRNIVTLDKRTKEELGVTSGDIVKIRGTKTTAAVIWPARAEDEGKGIIRMDNLIRHNAGAGLGEKVTVSKSEYSEAKKVVLAPTQEVRIIASGYDRILKKNFIGRPLTKGDNVWISVFGSGFVYQVVDSNPKGIVKVTDFTQFVLKEEPVKDAMGGIPKIAYEDIGGLDEQIQKIREMIELPMRHPEIFRKLGINPPKGVLLHGPPGTGKTLLAKAVANETQAHFISINSPSIMSKFVGEAEERIREVFKEAEKNAPSIIFFDEIDAIAPKRDEVVGEVERRVVAQILSAMDGMEARGNVIVIAATNRINSLDEALRRPGRFDREVEIGVPTKEGRKSILSIHTRGMPISPPNDMTNMKHGLGKIKKDVIPDNRKRAIIFDYVKFLEHMELKVSELDEKMSAGEITEEEKKKSREEFIEMERKKFFGGLSTKEENELGNMLRDQFMEEMAVQLHGFVGADLEALAKEAAMKALRRYLPKINLEEETIPAEVLENLYVYKSDFTEALKDVQPSALREVAVEVPNIRWKDVGGLDYAKRELKQAVEWPLKFPAEFRKMGIKAPRGVLIYGPPGTGKTLLAKAVATESEANFISVKGPQLISMWVGESERGVRKVFQRARQVAPVVIFFDEIDAIATTRGGMGDSGVSDRVVNQLLTELDGIEELKDVIFIAATNRPDLIDPALLRPGRIDKIISVPAPDEKAREEILKVHLAGINLEDVSSRKDRTSKPKQIIDPERRKEIVGLLAKELAAETEGFSGADLEGMIREAALIALQSSYKGENTMLKAVPVTFEHIKEAKEKIQPSISMEVAQAYDQFRKKLSSIKLSYVR